MAPHPDQLSELERDGWQLLLWSFRSELGSDDPDPREQQDDGTQRQ